MRNLTRVFTFLSLIAFGVGAALAKDTKKQEAEALLAKAREISDIRCDGCKPFRLEADIRSHEGDGVTLEGKYKLYWVSADQWRDEFTWPDYKENRVGLAEKIWVKRSARFRPAYAGSIFRISIFGFYRTPATAASIKKNTKKDLPSGPSVCLELKQDGNTQIQCFLRETAHLVREETSMGAVDYEEHVPFAGKIFPRRILQFVGRTLSREIRITNLQILQEPATGLFGPLTGPDVRETCREPEPPRLFNSVVPTLPDSLMGRFKINMEVGVGSDGSAEIIEMFVPNPHIGPYVRKAVSRWQFSPAKCGPAPIDAEVHISLDIGHRH